MFRLRTDLQKRGDQPHAIERLVQGVNQGTRSQVLLGITGSGKTFTMANVIAESNQPALVLAHNKTLAAQLYQEFKTLFPDNAVEYFVSYYDYYQPEAYIPRTDTYIEKDLAINDQIDRMRLSATRSLLERDDCLIVSSVSCIYGLGVPEYYSQMQLSLKKGQSYRRDDLLFHLVAMHYSRNDMELSRSHFRVRGDLLEIMPAYEEKLAYRLEFFDEELERISEIDPLTGRVHRRCDDLTIYPGSHHVTPEEVRVSALETIRQELQERVAYFEKENRLVELQRLIQRTRYDLEMIQQVGTCKGIENYSRHFNRRQPGQAPPCLLDYFPQKFLLLVDESHQTIPQIHAMYNGDRARKTSLVEYGFRLPSAFDNRPLKFEEFYQRIHQVIYVSATPGKWEIEEAKGEVVEQIIRPTGLLDPKIEVRPATTQVDDCLEAVLQEVEKGGRVLITTLTKKLAEDLSNYFVDLGVKAKYLHSDIHTIERVQILNDLRKGLFDVLIGINLLREGLDLPEVSLVCILDGDKEGFLRSQTALIQTCGRAARNLNGWVILYADKKTEAIEQTLQITQRRRELQRAHNQKHGIIPQSAQRERMETLLETFDPLLAGPQEKKEPLTREEILNRIETETLNMHRAAKALHFEEAARLRDQVQHYQQLLLLEDHL
jgi:excinuclease ABC subunit B